MAHSATPAGSSRPLIARADAQDRLISADDHIASLQRSCGGDIPGVIAVPELLQMVRKARGYGMKLGRALTMVHPGGSLSGWADIEPEDEGCTIRLSDWTVTEDASTGPAASDEGSETRLAIEQLLSEAVLWLDGRQAIVALETGCAELSPLIARARENRGQHWSTLFELSGEAPPHWGARSGIVAGIKGSSRRWHLMLAGGQSGMQGHGGGQQLLIRRHEEAIGAAPANDEDLLPEDLLSMQLAPALEAPVRRIIRNGEIMRDRLTGPLSREYVNSAGDSVNAGAHLAGLAEGLAGGEAASDPNTVELELGDIAESACRLQTTRAARRQARFTIAYHPALALGDRRWCMQILLNLLGNAVDYGPRGGEILVDCAQEGKWTRIAITDEGETLSADQRELVFRKYERLGRDGGGTGLGLHISRRLAEAMGGTLTVAPGANGGNCFTLRLKSAAGETGDREAG